MIRCPVICIVQVWAYSSANDAEQRGQVEHGDDAEPGQVAGRDVAVDDQLGQVRRRQLEHRVADDRDDARSATCGR